MDSDYFVNHPRAARFPWSIYHRPIERNLARWMAALSEGHTHADVLVLGAGYLHELPVVPANLRLTATDIDDRVTQHLTGIRDERLVRCATIRDAESIASLGRFDAIYGKEVIEHIVEAERYAAALASVLKPGGEVWLSTPNYGDPWLPAVESTILELIGRMSGYSRRDIHPRRFSVQTLTTLLSGAGLGNVHVVKTPLKLALIGIGRRPRDR